MTKKKRQKQSLPIVTADIETFSHDGRGIARINGKATFVQGALPGETVTIQYTERKRDYDQGYAISVLSPSAARVKPACVHYDACGGCSLQHLNEDTQIHVKQNLLLDSLRRIGHIQPERLLPPLTSSSWNYRSKARLSVRYDEHKQQTLVGFRKKNNPQMITSIQQCPVLHAGVDKELGRLNQLINSLDATRAIAQVEIAAGDDEIALIFRHLQPLTNDDQQKLRDFGQQTGFRLFLQPKGPDSISLFYPEQSTDFLHYSLPDEDICFRFHPTDFTQVNAALNRKMIQLAMELMDVQADDVILDLFCGLGNFSLPLARRCNKVIGIEGSDAMVERAKNNAIDNAIVNTKFYCANLDEMDAMRQVVPDEVTKILLDPPRTGALAIVKQIHKLNPKRIVYVSCNPATLARDSDILVNQQGYRLKAAGVMDMFPHTAHVESIALFEKER